MGGVHGSCRCTSSVEDGDGREAVQDAAAVAFLEDDSALYGEKQGQVVARPRPRSVRQTFKPQESQEKRDSLRSERSNVDAFLIEPEPATTYQISLDRGKGTSSDVGLELDVTGEKELPVTRIRGGLAQMWNVANPALDMKTGDVVVEVNGVSGDVVRMLRRFNTDDTLQITLRRSSNMEVPRTRHFQYLLVGGGVATGYACRELVQNGVTRGAVAIMAGEDVPPYERPALTKAYLHHPGAKARARLPGFHCCVGSGGERQDASWYAEKGITFLEGPASAIDLEKKMVTSETGAEVTYDKLILATGCRPNSLKIPGIDLGGIFYVREEQDCAELVSRLEALHSESNGNSTKRKAVIIGGGYIGMEVTAAVMGWNLEVTWLFPEDHALPRLLDATMAEWLEAQFTARGAKIIKGSVLAELVGDQGVVQGARLKSGITLACDLVVIGVGSTPNVEFCTGLTMVKGGFKVDSNMQTSASGVYAVGDICAFPSRYGGHKRHEHVDHARKSAAQAAQAAMGLSPPPYDYLPYFYSRIFEYTEAPVILNCYGDHSGKCNSLVRKKKEKVVGMWAKSGKVTGALLMSSPGPSPEEQKKLQALAAAQPKAADIASVFKDAGL